MLKKESFFQYLFVQSLGYTNTKINNLANNSPVEISTVKRNSALINQSLDLKSINEAGLLKPLKLKTVKSQTFLLLFTKTKKQKNKPNYRVKFKNLVMRRLSPKLINGLDSNYGTNNSSSSEKKETKNSNSGIFGFSKIFLPTLGFSQQINWLEKGSTKNQTNKSNKNTLTRSQSPSNVLSMPEEQRYNKPLKISQNIFLFNKELRKLYIPNGAKYECPPQSGDQALNELPTLKEGWHSTRLLDKNDKQNELLRKHFQQNSNLLTNFQLSQKSLPTGHRLSKKDKNKAMSTPNTGGWQTSYNIFLTYKKSFLSYWLLPFFGLISLTGSNVSSISEGQRLYIKSTNQYTSLNGNHLTKSFEIPNFSKKSLESNLLNNQTKDNYYLYSKWQTSSGQQKMDSFASSKPNGLRQSINKLSKPAASPRAERIKNSFLNNSLELHLSPSGLDLRQPPLFLQGVDFRQNSNSIEYNHKRLFFKIFDLTYNSNSQYLKQPGLGLSLSPQLIKGLDGSQPSLRVGKAFNFETTQKLKLESQINFQKLNFQILKTNILKPNKLDFIWFDFFLKNYNSNSNSLSQAPFLIDGHKENNQYSFPNKLSCNLALLNNSTYLEKLSTKETLMLDRLEENKTKDLLLTKLNDYTVFNSGVNQEKVSMQTKDKEVLKGNNSVSQAYSNWKDFLQTTLRQPPLLIKGVDNGINKIKASQLSKPFINFGLRPSQTKDLILNKKYSTILTWGFKNQQKSEHFLLKQTETLPLNGTLTGISPFGPRAAHQNKNIFQSQPPVKRMGVGQFNSTLEGLSTNKNIYKTTQLTWSTIKVNYTKLLANIKDLQNQNNGSKIVQKNNKKLAAIFTKISKKSLTSAISIQLSPEKSIKKALFLLDSVWLNYLCPSGMVDTLEKPSASLLNNTVVNLLKTSSPDGYKDTFINNSGNFSKNNNKILKDIQTLNDNIVFVLKTKHKVLPIPVGYWQKLDRLLNLKTTTSISKIEKGKVLSINNRNILYRGIFDGLKNNLNQIIQSTLYKDLSLLELKDSLDLSNKATTTPIINAGGWQGTVLKLNRPIFGGNVSNNNNYVPSKPFYYEFRQNNLVSNLNSTDSNKNGKNVALIGNTFDPLKNTNKLNFKISNLPITLISPNLILKTGPSVPEGARQTKNLKKQISPKFVENSLYQKREPFVIFGNYLKTITTKIRKGLGSFSNTIPSIEPYQTNLGNKYLWAESFAHNTVESKKLGNKTKLPKIERLFLSYLSQSKLGEKNKAIILKGGWLTLGQRSTNPVFIKQKSLNNKKIGQFNQSIQLNPQTSTVPLKIKNLAKKQLLKNRTQGKANPLYKNRGLAYFTHKGYKQNDRLLTQANLNKLAYFKTNSRKSFPILLKNRLFVNKKQNGEYWGTLTTSSLKASKVIDHTDKIIQESRRKKQQIKLKRRLKKMQCATRRRKKRKIFYPRPKWLTFKMYENYLNSRFSSKENFITNPKLKTKKLGINLTKIQPVYSYLGLKDTDVAMTNGKKWDKKSKDFYQISPIVSRDLRRILMKSNWLRNYLNPYLDKIKYIYKEIEKDSKSLNVFFKLKAFIQDLYGSNLQLNRLSNSPSVASSVLGVGSLFEPNQASTKTKNENSPMEQNNCQPPVLIKGIGGTILNFEYNRIIYQRLQRIILNIRENLNLNGQLKNKSQKLAKNIRPFIKRDYIKRDNPMTGNQNENIFTKTLKKNLLNFRRNFIMLNNGYEEPSIYTAETLSPLVRNNFYWALNRTEKGSNSNSRAYIKNIWEKYKIREINKNNKTKKMLYSLVKKYQDLLSDQNTLEPFYNTLETDLSMPEDPKLNIQTKKFYKQKPFSTRDTPINNFIYDKPSPIILNGDWQIYIPNGQLNLSNTISFENKTLLNLEKLNNRNNQNPQEFMPNGHKPNLTNTQAKIKRNLLATKNYIDKTETKLINVENKLKLLGLGSTKIKPSSLYSLVETPTNNKELNTFTGLDSFSINSIGLSPKGLDRATHNIFKVLVNNKQLKKQSNAIFKASTMPFNKFGQQQFIRISTLKYKKIYFRFFKQNLLKENKFFVPYAKTKRNIEAQRGLAEPFYLEKMEKLFYSIKQRCFSPKLINSLDGALTENIATPNNLSGIKITNNIQNFNKFSSTTYWWTKVQINKYLTPKYTVGTQNKKLYSESLTHSHSNNFNLKSETGLIGLYPTASKTISIPLMSILFHFCTLITLVSLGGVRNVLKFYYILVSKLYKVINSLSPKLINGLDGAIPFAKSTKASSMSFGHRLQKTTLNKPSLPKGEKSLIKQGLGPKTVSQSMRNSHKLLVTSFKTIKLLSLKYLLVNVRVDYKKDGDPINAVKNLNQNILSKTLDLTEKQHPLLIDGVGIQSFTQDMIPPAAIPPAAMPRAKTQKQSTLLSSVENKNLLLASDKNSSLQGKISNGLSLGSSRLDGTLKKETNIMELVNFYLQSKKISQKSNELPTLKEGWLRGNQFNRIKIEVLFDTNQNLSVGLNIVHKVSFYTYLLMLKSVDVLVAPAYLIYKFFEKPGEYVVENLAYSFLLEWSADLISTIPDSIDPALANYYMKLQRNLPLYLFLNPKNINISLIGQNPIFSNQAIKSTGFNTMLLERSPSNANPQRGLAAHNILNGGLKTLVNTMESIFGIFVLSIQNSILRRFTNTSLLLFTQQITEPDSDFINRQKKGIIFWDLWGESLKTIAEKNAVNIYELSTDKAEQLKLLSNMQNSNLLNQNQNTFAFDQTKIYLRKASFLEPTRAPSSFGNNSYIQSQTPLNTRISFKTESNTHNWLSRLGNQIFGLNLLGLDKTSEPNKFSNKKYLAQNGLLVQKEKLFETQRWAVNQFLNYQGKDTELFIDMHPPRTFANAATALKYAFAIQAPIGSIVCQIFGGIFYKQISKNILVVLHNSSQTNKGLEKSLLIQAIAGETELKIITDNAHRYAMVVQGVAVGIKLLKDVFEALCATGPCIFLLEDIHAIGERRPFLIDEASPNLTESIYNKNQSMQAFLLKEKSSASREILYKTNKHLLTNYKKPYKEFKSLASNHFSFNFLYRGSSLTKRRTGDIQTTEVPLSIQVSQKEKEIQDTNLEKKSSFDVTNATKKVANPNNILNKRYISESKSQNLNSSNKVFGSFSQLIKTIKNKQSLINPPASSPFNLLLMKESTKLKPTQNVKEMAWFGLPGEQYSLISKYNYSIRIKVALLADSVLSNLSVKLEMITDLLVIIDSVKGNRGFIIFATTHLPDILDPALRRPGRFDETLSLPFIPSLYSRWTNYRYNLQYLNTCLSPKLINGLDGALVKQYSIPFNSTFNKGLPMATPWVTTLDFLKLPISSSNSQMEALFPIYNSMKSFGRMARLKTQNTDIAFSKVVKYKTTDLSYLVKEFLRFSYSRSASYASNTILSFMLYTSLNNSDKNVNRNSQKTKFSESCLSSNLIKGLNRAKDNNNTALTVLKWPTLLRLGSSGIKDSNFNSNIFENYSNYLSLFAPTYFNNTSFGQMLLLSFITYKMGETFGFATNLKRHYSIRTLSTKSKLTSSFQENIDIAKTGIGVVKSNQKITNKIPRQGSSRLETKKTVKKANPNTGGGFVLNFSKNSEWKKGPSLLYSYLQKRLPQNTQKGKQNFNYSTFYSTQLLNFNNNYSLMEPPSPPITNILLPAKRYENYRRSFKNLYNLNIEQDTVSEKLKLHQQQRLLKRLYNYPIKEFFRNEKFYRIKSEAFNSITWWKLKSSTSLSSTQKAIMPGMHKTHSHNSNLNKFKPVGLKDKITFAQSYFTFAGIENFAQKNMASLNKFSSIDYSYRNILYNRHKTYLTNQWWNGQQGEHNLETTFLSDIDWRYTQLSNSLSNATPSSGINTGGWNDIQVDFPDCDQFYNPRNRRWILTTGDWNHWFNLEADLNNIYSHYISESLTKAYKTIDQNREILDFYSAKLLSTAFNLLDLVDSLDSKGRDLDSLGIRTINTNQNSITENHRSMSESSLIKTKVNLCQPAIKIKGVGGTFEDLTHREILNLYKRFFYKSHFK